MTKAEMLADVDQMLGLLELKVDSGRRTLGGGMVGFGPDGKATCETWGNEPIMVYRNPDGPKAAALIRSLVVTLNQLGKGE